MAIEVSIRYKQVNQEMIDLQQQYGKGAWFLMDSQQAAFCTIEQIEEQAAHPSNEEWQDFFDALLMTCEVADPTWQAVIAYHTPDDLHCIVADLEGIFDGH